jgi:hypothetical protein
MDGNSKTIDGLIREAQAAGLTIDVIGGRVRLRGKGTPPEALVQRVREHRGEVLEFFRGAASTAAEPIDAMPAQLATAVALALSVIPGSQITTVATKLPSLAAGEPFTAFLEFGDGTVERYQPTERAHRKTAASRQHGGDLPKQRGAETLPLPFTHDGRKRRADQGLVMPTNADDQLPTDDGGGSGHPLTEKPSPT